MSDVMMADLFYGEWLIDYGLMQLGICISLMSDVMMADLFYGEWLID